MTTVDGSEERGLRLIAPVPAHDADCEADFGDSGQENPCRCAERERDWDRQDREFERRMDQ